MKTLTTFLVAICLAANAQMMPMTTTIHTPYGNVRNTTYRYQPMFYGNQMSAKPKFVLKKISLTIMLKNDSVMNVRGKYDAESKQNTITLKNDSGVTVIKPIDTKKVIRTFLMSEFPTMYGIPADSCWLFQVISGKINGYSNVPVFNESYTIAIQKMDGPIVKLTQSNLEDMIQSRSEKLDKLLRKNRLIDAIKEYNKPTAN